MFFTLCGAARVSDLKTEGEFFAYESLVVACQQCISTIDAVLEQSFKEPKAHSGITTVATGDSKTYHVGKGQVLYIVSATLAGRCKVGRYCGYPEEDIPSCYLRTCEEDDTGDFQLFAQVDNSAGCIAHVGLDQIHVDRPTDIDFRQDLRLCMAPRNAGHITLTSVGAGEWHIMYWIGHAGGIPHVMTNEGPQKRRRGSTAWEQFKSLAIVLCTGLYGGIMRR